MFKGSTLKWAASIAAIAVIAGVALSAAPASAAKGGVHGSGQTSSGALVVVSPNPVPAHSWYTWTGSGFLPSKIVYVSGCGGAFNLWAGSAGSFYTGNTAGSGGTCTYYFSQYNGRKKVLMFTLSMTVQ